MKYFIFRIIGILGFAVMFVPTYFGEEMVEGCIDPETWTLAHTHPEMLSALFWIAGGFPFLWFGIKSGLFVDTENELPSWQKSLSFAMFWLIVPILTYASIIGGGCPYAVNMKNFLILAVPMLLASSLLIYLNANKKEVQKKKEA